MGYLDNFDPAFWLTVGTMSFGFFGVALNYILKSKCDQCSCCWGVIRVHRNTEIERDLEMGAVPAPDPAADPAADALNAV